MIDREAVRAEIEAQIARGIAAARDALGPQVIPPGAEVLALTTLEIEWADGEEE